jgi:hypothetical protein
MEKKQSSVEWFQEQIIKIVNGTCELSEIEIFDQAKAMHKEEIKDAVNSCGYQDEAEYYYKETFGGKK